MLRRGHFIPFCPYRAVQVNQMRILWGKKKLMVVFQYFVSEISLALNKIQGTIRSIFCITKIVFRGEVSNGFKDHGIERPRHHQILTHVTH